MLLLFDDEFILWFQTSQNLKVSSEEAEAIDFPSGDLKKKNEELNWGSFNLARWRTLDVWPLSSFILWMPGGKDVDWELF